MDTALLGLRVVLSLACVLGLIWFAGRKLQGSAGVRKQRSVPLSVLGRQSLGKGAGIALVEVAGRVLLLGVGEQGVRVLTEVDVPAAPDVAPARGGEVREEIDLALLPLDLDVDEAPDADLDAVAATDVAIPAPAAPDDRTDDRTDDPADDADDRPVADLPRPHPEGTARLAALAGLAAGASATQARASQARVQAGVQECTAPTGALSGSILSPDTWRRAVDVVQRRTAR